MQENKVKIKNIAYMENKFRQAVLKQDIYILRSQYSKQRGRPRYPTIEGKPHCNELLRREINQINKL